VRINGSAASRIENIRLEKVAMDFSRWTKYSGGEYDNRPTKVLTPIETHVTDGFNLRFADKVSLESCSVNWADNGPAYFQNSVAAEDVTGLQLSNFQGDSAAHPIRVR
jgi:hypothetical protein